MVLEPLEKSQNQQLADYFKKNFSKGYTPDALKFSLMKQGYSKTSVEKAYETASKQMAMQAPKMVEKPTVTYSYDEAELKRKVAEDSRNSGNFITRFFRRLFG